MLVKSGIKCLFTSLLSPAYLHRWPSHQQPPSSPVSPHLFTSQCPAKRARKLEFDKWVFGRGDVGKWRAANRSLRVGIMRNRGARRCYWGRNEQSWRDVRARRRREGERPEIAEDGRRLRDKGAQGEGLVSRQKIWLKWESNGGLCPGRADLNTASTLNWRCAGQYMALISLHIRRGPFAHSTHYL